MLILAVELAGSIDVIKIWLAHVAQYSSLSGQFICLSFKLQQTWLGKCTGLLSYVRVGPQYPQHYVVPFSVAS